MINPATNFGALLWATNEDSNAMTLWFRSSEYSNSALWPVLEVIYSTAPKTVYFLKDHLGSIRATVLDSATAPVIGYDDYDAWGYPLASRTKPIPNAYLQGASKNKFTGKERDDEFGLNLVAASMALAHKPNDGYICTSRFGIFLEPAATEGYFTRLNLQSESSPENGDISESQNSHLPDKVQKDAAGVA